MTPPPKKRKKKHTNKKTQQEQTTPIAKHAQQMHNKMSANRNWATPSLSFFNCIGTGSLTSTNIYHKRLWAKLTTVTQRLRDEWETWWVNQGLNTKPLNQGPQHLTSWPCPNWSYTAGAVIRYHSTAIRSWIHQSPDLSPKHLCYWQPSLQEENLTIWKLSHLHKSAVESPTLWQDLPPFS